MNEWHDLFVATAGSSAGLTGLIFVGVSINLAKILSFSKLPERALIALIFLLTILILSILLLIPNQSFNSIGIELLVIGIVVWAITIKLDTSIYKNTPKEFKKSHFFNITVNQLAIIPYIIAGIILLNGHESGIYWIVPGFILSLIKSIMDSWILLVEINR